MRAPVSNSVDEARSAGRIHDGSTGLRLRGAVNHFAPVAVLVALLTALGLFRPSFLSLYSLSVLAGKSSVILLLAIGQTIVILLGGIDLSMAALASLVSVLLALALPGRCGRFSPGAHARDRHRGGTGLCPCSCADSLFRRDPRGPWPLVRGGACHSPHYRFRFRRAMSWLAGSKAIPLVSPTPSPFPSPLWPCSYQYSAGYPSVALFTQSAWVSWPRFFPVSRSHARKC